MAVKVITSGNFKKKLAITYLCLKKEWSEKIANEFLNKVEYAIGRLSKYPTHGPVCKKQKDVRKLIIPKHNKVYYKVEGDIIYILALFDTRQDPKKNKYE